MTLGKSDLLNLVERAIIQSGWRLLLTKKEHPFGIRVFHEDNDVSMDLLVYIWNLTHGGGTARPVDEYRIQITGIDEINGHQRFIKEGDAQTIILGWWQDGGVFAAFDYEKHSLPLGSSSSIQIRKSCLEQALQYGLAVMDKENGEIVAAFRPDLFMAYVMEKENIHQMGEVPDDLKTLVSTYENPDTINDSEIEAVSNPNRRETIRSVRTRLRKSDFRRRILNAYENRCAVCGVQLELVEAAHIIPVADERSTDLTPNGMALCPLHHKAFDQCLITVSDEYKVLINENERKRLSGIGLIGGIDRFQENLFEKIFTPSERDKKPNIE